MNQINKLITVALIAIGFLGAPVHAQEANVKELADNVHMINLMGYTSLVVIGDDGVLITDTANPFRAARLRDEIAKLTDKPVTKLVLSHEHFDHTGGTEVFADAEIIAHENAKSLVNLDPLGLFPDEIHTTVDQELVIDMGTTTVELRHFGSADGAAALVVYLPAENIALTADLYGERSLSRAIMMSDTNLLGKRETLNALVDWNLTHSVNGHTPNTDPAILIEEAAFLNDLYDAVLPQVQEILMNATSTGTLIGGIIEMSEALELPEYEDWANYNELPAYGIQMAFALVHAG